MGIFADYKDYKVYNPEYKPWKDKRNLDEAKRLEYLKQNPRVSVGVLENSGHYYYDEKDWSFLLGKFESILI